MINNFHILKIYFIIFKLQYFIIKFKLNFLFLFLNYLAKLGMEFNFKYLFNNFLLKLFSFLINSNQLIQNSKLNLKHL